MAHGAFDRREAGTRLRHQLMAHAQEVFGDDVEVRVGKQMVDIGDAARDGVLDWDHRVVGVAAFDSRNGVLERRIGDRLEIGIGFARRKMRIRARLTLIGYFGGAGGGP